MTTETTTVESTEATAEAKAKTIQDVPSRTHFATLEEMTAYLQRLSGDIKDFSNYPLAAPGLDAEGFDAAMYGEGMEACVSILTNKKGSKGYDESRPVRAIVATPMPTLEALMARADGVDFVRRIIRKELNHIAVRQLRDAADVSSVVPEMPTTIDGYISTGRESSSALETFNTLYKSINDTLSKMFPAWSRRKIYKRDLRSAMESKAFALEYFGSLEDRGEGKESLFVIALKLGQAAAKAKALDSSIFDRWMETRDAKTIDVSDEDDGDEEEVSFESLAAAMLAEPEATESAPAPADEQTGSADEEAAAPNADESNTDAAS